MNALEVAELLTDQERERLVSRMVRKNPRLGGHGVSAAEWLELMDGRHDAHLDRLLGELFDEYAEELRDSRMVVIAGAMLGYGGNSEPRLVEWCRGFMMRKRLREEGSA